jgi:hypothetical protein
VPTPDDEVASGGLAAAWAGGARGRRVIDRLLPLVPRLLSARGEMFMVAVHENDPAGGWNAADVHKTSKGSCLSSSASRLRLRTTKPSYLTLPVSCAAQVQGGMFCI